jgi:cytidylate kinase
MVPPEWSAARLGGYERRLDLEVIMAWKLGSRTSISPQALERQMNNWELARLQRLERATTRRPDVEDFITVSRQVGVAGEQVAERLGQRLGWPVFGKKLLEAMAGDDVIRTRIYASMDERDLKWWQETLRSLLDQDFDLNDYFHQLSETVLSLARQGSCIFIGRGCDMILPSSLGFRVRLVAPLEDRLRALEEKLGLSSNEAQSELVRIATERREFLRHHYRADADDPTRHDLLLNLGRWSTTEAVEALLAARALKIRARTEAAG